MPVYEVSDNSAKMQKLKTTDITGWLLSIGMLTEAENEQGKKRKIPTPNGEMPGMKEASFVNEQAEQQKIRDTSVKALKTVLFFWTIRGYIQKCNSPSEKAQDIIPKMEIVRLTELFISRIALAKFIVSVIYEKALLAVNQ